MKREEKNRLTRQRIMSGAVAEFAQRGYAAGSINTICAAEGISKGIIYHYFETKDELYLACVEECFLKLTEFLQGRLTGEGLPQDRLESYFSARAGFFHDNPMYQAIFCEAVISPPANLADAIEERKRPFDELNIGVLESVLENMPLRDGVSMPEVVELFRQYQDFINATSRTLDFAQRDERCKKALDLILYGVIKR